MATEQLLNFLNERRTKTNKKSTHTGIGTIQGKYTISVSERNKLFELVSKLNEPVALLELQGTNYLPVIVDVDLKSDKNKNLYTNNQVKEIVRIYQNVLRKYLLDVHDENLTCFLMEKPKPQYNEKGNYYKHGFHLHFPQVFVSRQQLKYDITPLVTSELEKIFDGTNLPCEPKKLIDTCIYDGKGKGWFLYGCGKDDMAYEITKVYDANTNEYSTWTELIPDNKMDLIDFFSIQFVEAKKKFMFETNNDLKIEPVEMKPEQIPVIVQADSNDFHIEMDLDNETDIWVDNILEMLDEKWYTERDSWMHIGWILFNIYHGKKDGLERWKTFSKKCPSKYNEQVLRQTWDKMEMKNVTLGSLKYIAKMNYPSKYNALKQKFTKQFTKKCCESLMTHYDIALMLYNLFEDEFVCAHVSKNVWYQFVNGYWCMSDDGVSLRNKISTDIVTEINHLREDALKVAYENMQKEGKMKMLEEDLKKLSSIDKLISSLKSTPFKKNVMSEAKDLFYNESFTKNLDSSPYLFGFKNGVIDLRSMEFRPGEPSDYLSLFTDIKYNPTLTLEHPKVKAIIKYFEEIFPNPNIRNFFIRLNSFVFVGGNLQKYVQVWSGNGDNGKSITEKIFEKMLGKYCVKLPTSLITGKRTQSSSACPELVRAGFGVRYAFVQEPSKKDIINTGILKELSGNDTFYARGLFKEGMDITPMFKLVMVCNEPPKVEGSQSDQATWNRIRVLPFESKFVDDAPSTREEQMKQKKFPIDREFDNKIPDLLEGLVFLLLHEYKKGVPLVEPNEVKLATQMYKDQNDFYGIFLQEQVEDRDDEILSLLEVYQHFKDWFRDSYSLTIPSRQELKEYLIKAWGKPDNENNPAWKNKCIRFDTEELLN